VNVLSRAKPAPKSEQVGVDDSWPADSQVTNLEAVRAQALAAIADECPPDVAERIVGIVLDRLITHERAARRAAAAASQAKAQFLAIMSHELRTPLNAIAGYVQLLEMGIRGPINEQQRADLERIGRSQQYLTRLVCDVLDFARMEVGQLTVAIDDVSLADALDAADAFIAPQARANGIIYEYRRPARSLTVRGDRERLEQVVLNLLSNAVKFTPAGGRVTLDCTMRATTVIVRVRDTGRGIPTELHGQIFEPFTQVDQSYTRAVGGAGLGLAISRELSRAMGADLTVESAPGRGSTFAVRLERGSARKSPPHPLPLAAAKIGLVS
jgi:signal transduction histidine kinase